MIKELSSIDYNNEIKDGLVIVDFYATWCGPCKMMHPILEEISKEYNIKVLIIDVDKYENLAREFAVMSIPTLILYKDGNIVRKNIGFTPKNILEEWIENEK